MSDACIACGAGYPAGILSLGEQPLANAYLTEAQLAEPEPRYPLELRRCTACGLVQVLPVATSADIFTEYAYFSSFSTTWLEHAARYADMIVARCGLGPESFVLEIASNDGYLLRNFVAKGIPCLGIEPAGNVAEAALALGVPTEVCFWTKQKAEELSQARRADLVIGNNVFAHTPQPDDFAAGLAAILLPQGVITLEFPHLMRLVAENQFDTIYHEHFSYYALFVVQRMLARHGLLVFDVEELPTHGGSLRVYAQRAETGAQPVSPAVEKLVQRELAAGMDTDAYYADFRAQVEGVRREVRSFLQDAREAGKRVAGYGAPAKGNTLLNYCGITSDLIEYTVDRSPHKQGRYLPGSRIPVRSPQAVSEEKPDYLFILPWNLREEIMEQMSHIREWGGQFVVPIPCVQVCP